MKLTHERRIVDHHETGPAQLVDHRGEDPVLAATESRAVVVSAFVRRNEEDEGVGGIMFGERVLERLLKYVGPPEQGHVPVSLCWLGGPRMQASEIACTGILSHSEEKPNPHAAILEPILGGYLSFSGGILSCID